ncbi:MAG: NifB/NifX family molybdenum-iron cluster-binding protein [Planctomycetes bacterium]|nr:NifB/NifX family molybdenum-iron cluster-binding protein [Planctomycetota bacterium]
MKIAITSTGKTLDSNVDPRFGRTAYFIIADTETEEFDAIENSNVQASGGAGISSAKVVIDTGAKVVIAGNFGPNAQRTLDAAGVKSYTGVTGTVAEAIELFKSGKLTQATEPNVQSHFGMDS